MRQFTLGLGLVALASFGACSDSGNTATGPGKQVKLAVAPLHLDGIGDACYDIRVKNGLGQVVWAVGDPRKATDTTLPDDPGDDATAGDAKATGSICATVAGNGIGGDISWVGPCDAQEPLHNITVWVHGLYDAGGAELGDTNWENPCAVAQDADPNDPSGWTGGCVKEFSCLENADVSVFFSFAVMRTAHQGFFDIAVNFEDTFCSGKVDTCTTDSNPGTAINLLFNFPGFDRVQTAVIAFACTAGPGENTTMFASDYILNCTDGNASAFDASASLGNHNDGPLGWAATNATAANNTLYEWAAYRGEEGLPCNGQNCNKLYWNAAFAIKGSHANCKLTQRMTTGTVGAGQFLLSGAVPNNKWHTPATVNYPVDKANVNLTDGSGNLLCIHVPIFENNGGRINAPFYTDNPATPGVVEDDAFCNSFGPSDTDISVGGSVPAVLHEVGCIDSP